MKPNHYLAAALAAGSLMGILALAQGRDSYKAMLSSLPIDAKSRQDMTGSGSVTGVLEGSKLTIQGSFEGLKSKSTSASLHDSVATGVRGPSIHDLLASSGTSGTISGMVELTGDQVDHLKKGRLYVQLYSEKATDGVLWGWFLH
jgi:hypothetical protein